MQKLVEATERAETKPEAVQQNVRDTMLLLLNTLVPNNPHGPLHALELGEVVETFNRTMVVAIADGATQSSVAVLAYGQQCVEGGAMGRFRDEP